VLVDIDLLRRPPNSAGLQALLDNRGYNIVMTETELNGPERFAADNVLTEKQCQALMKLANVSLVLSSCSPVYHATSELQFIIINTSGTLICHK